jgi:hypothetical protein
MTPPPHTPLDVEIDGFANSVIHRLTDQSYPTRLVPYHELTEQQRQVCTKWRFAWPVEPEQGQDVIALLVENSDSVQGLIACEDSAGFVFVHLVESAPHNIGQNKVYKGVPGNLFAFVCARSFRLGNDGYVSFLAKTELVEHYRMTLGAERIGTSDRMVIPTTSAARLIENYFKESDKWPL